MPRRSASRSRCTWPRPDKTITVGAAQSLLEAIEAAGVEAPYLCRGGACGQCETDVLGCDGHIEHNDHWLTDEQKAVGQENHAMRVAVRGQVPRP